jgi:GTP cyclohydrolase I
MSEADNVFELDPAHVRETWTERTRDITPADWARYRDAVAEIFEAFGMDLDTPGTRETPERFLRALFDSTAGYEGDPKLLTAFPAEGVGGLVVEGPIGFSALCEHHALPFFGTAHVGYIAGEQIIGISKFTRLVRMYARRFTVQERLGEQIAKTLDALVEPEGVAVHLEASHLCTRMRGVEEHSSTVTTFWRGSFEDNFELRREFLQLVRG